MNSHFAVGSTSAAEAPKACPPGLWLMTMLAANTSSGRLLHTDSVSRPPGLPDRDGRRPGPCRAQIRRVSPVWTACRSCGPANDLLRFGRGRVCSSSALRCLAVFRCAAADSVYGGSKTGGSSVGGRTSTQARLCQRPQATSTHWPLSEVRLPVCVRGGVELTSQAFVPTRVFECVGIFSVNKFRIAHCRLYRRSAAFQILYQAPLAYPAERRRGRLRAREWHTSRC